jgi:hypothetical protein
LAFFFFLREDFDWPRYCLDSSSPRSSRVLSRLTALLGEGLLSVLFLAASKIPVRGVLQKIEFIFLERLEATLSSHETFAIFLF